MKDKITLKGNGSFYIREGWLTKGLVEIAKNPELFSKKNNEGADALGVGSAMSKSIRYWLLTAGLIVKDSKLSPLEYENKKGHFISKTGKYILDNDRYIENKDTLWIIHYNIASNYREATVWNLFFNIVGEERFNRRELESMMENELYKRTYGEKISDKIRQTRAKQVLPPKRKTEKRKNRFHNTVYFLLFLFRKSSIL